MEKNSFLLLALFLILSCMVVPSEGKKQTQALGHLYKSKMKGNSGISKSLFKAIHHINKTRIHPQEGMKEKELKSCLDNLMSNFHSPGCSSLAYGAMEELGPFRVHSNGKTLYRNRYSWNYAANVLFLESPAGVGFSYSNTTSDYDESGDSKTAADNYVFLLNWFGRFPEYKGRDFISLIGNAVINDETDVKGMYDYFESHAPISDKTAYRIQKYSSDIIREWGESPSTIIPLLRELMANGLRVWIFSGDTDGRIPVTSTKYSINKMKLPVKTKWHPWYLDGEVGGYTQVYKGDLTFATVRGAGHQVPSFQPKRALTLIKHFIAGTPLPDTSKYI
ncbi:hypothetical protein CRYUN_Cryun01aG0256000 [Craigia yunnanensis]